MALQHVRKLTAWAVLGLFTLQTGCAGGAKTLERKDLVDPKPAEEYRVTTVDGRTLTFISLHLEGESLEGTVRYTTRETEGTGDAARTNVTNRYEEVNLPWSQVATVEAEQGRSSDNSVFFAAGALIAGVATFLLLTQGSTNPPTAGGGGKGPP